MPGTCKENTTGLQDITDTQAALFGNLANHISNQQEIIEGLINILMSILPGNELSFGDLRYDLVENARAHNENLVTELTKLNGGSTL